MPPVNQPPFDPVDHLLARPKPFGEGGLPPAHPPAGGSVGPVVGIIIIVILLVVGALYFWGAHLNAQNPEDQLPFIPADNSSTTIQ